MFKGEDRGPYDLFQLIPLFVTLSLGGSVPHSFASSSLVGLLEEEELAGEESADAALLAPAPAPPTPPPSPADHVEPPVCSVVCPADDEVVLVFVLVLSGNDCGSVSDG